MLTGDITRVITCSDMSRLGQPSDVSAGVAVIRMILPTCKYAIAVQTHGLRITVC